MKRREHKSLKTHKKYFKVLKSLQFYRRLNKIKRKKPLRALKSFLLNLFKAKLFSNIMKLFENDDSSDGEALTFIEMRNFLKTNKFVLKLGNHNRSTVGRMIFNVLFNINLCRLYCVFVVKSLGFI